MHSNEKQLYRKREGCSFYVLCYMPDNIDYTFFKCEWDYLFLRGLTNHEISGL